MIKNLEDTEKILTALKNDGINCAEITFRTACAKDAIALACEKFPDMNVGAGTVINGEQCVDALNAGAKFIVSPGLSVEVAEICKANGVPYYPGCVTRNNAGVRHGYNYGEIFPRERLRWLEGFESAFRTVSAGEVYTYRRCKQGKSR